MHTYIFIHEYLIYMYIIREYVYVYIYIYIYLYIYIYDDDDDDDIEFISTKIGSCRPLRSCGKKIIIK